MRERGGAEPASSGVRPASYGYGPAESGVTDAGPPRVPDPAPTADYPPSPRPDTGRADAYAGPPPPEPLDSTWPVPETEALELLPAGGHALLGLCIGMVVLLAVGFFYLGRASGPNQAAAPTTATAVSSMTPHATQAPTAAESRDIGAGFAWGKVLTNDGSTLTIKSEINLSEIVVHTDEHTKIYVLIATTIEAIAEGAPILVYGRKHADGSISADTITGVSLRALGTN